MRNDDLDVVGIWTEVKLSILKEYASAYARVLTKHPEIRHFAYIDGFSGYGEHVSRTSGGKVVGSPGVALTITPAFSHYHFIDLDGKRAAALRKLAAGRKNVSVYEGDCNEVLVSKVFPKCRYEDYHRALCVLDPYDLNPSWAVVCHAGSMRSIEILLTFMIMDANRNVFRRNPSKVKAEQVEKMTKFWGDESWKQIAYRQVPGLFEDIPEKETNERVITAYCERLKEIAGFKYVPEPLAMRNSKGATIYYLCFASNKEAGAKIARSVFAKYRRLEACCG